MVLNLLLDLVNDFTLLKMVVHFLIMLSDEASAVIFDTVVAALPLRTSAYPYLRVNHCRSFLKFIIHNTILQRIHHLWPFHHQRRTILEHWF